MVISVRDARERKSDLQFIERSLRDYLDDLSLSQTGRFPALPEIGQAELDQLAAWLADRNALLLAILDDQQPVGFSLVQRGSGFRMSEFFIARAMRHRGIGRSAVRLILDRFAGQWEVVQNQRNPAAVQFWRQVIGQYTRGDYRERIAGGEVRQMFRSGLSSGARNRCVSD
jgi:predicted acetyltransferase